MKKIGCVLLPFFAAALAVSCELYPMEPLRVTAWTPDTAVVDTAALEAVSLTFSADVPERLIESSFTLEEDDLPLDGTFVWLDDRTMRFQPHTPFSAHARYRITLATSAEDRDGNSLKEPFVHEFRGCADTERPALLSVTPADDSITDTVTPDLEFVFSEPMDRGSVLDGITISPPAAGYYTESANHAAFRFILTENLRWQTRYTMTIPGTVRDNNGNDKGSAETFSFFTGSDSRNPEIETVSVTRPDRTILVPDVPDDNTETVTAGIEKDAAILIRFSEPVARESAGKNLTITPAVPYDTSWNDDDAVLTLTPREHFPYDCLYTLVLAEGITDRQGNPLAASVTCKFRTDGAASRPPEIARAAFTNTFSAGTPVLPLTVLEPLSIITFSSAVCEAPCYGFFDIHAVLAPGASLVPASIYSSLSLSADNATVTPVACQTGESITFMASELPPETIPGAQVIRVVVDIDNSSAPFNDKSGKISLSFNTSLRDTFGNHLPEQWGIDVYTTN